MVRFPPPNTNGGSNNRPPVPSLNRGTNNSNNNTTTSTSTTSDEPTEREIMKNASKAWQTYQRPTFQGIGEEGKSNIQATITEFRAYEFLLRQEEG